MTPRHVPRLSAACYDRQRTPQRQELQEQPFGKTTLPGIAGIQAAFGHGFGFEVTAANHHAQLELGTDLIITHKPHSVESIAYFSRLQDRFHSVKIKLKCSGAVGPVGCDIKNDGV
jgi:hypothetical protein